MSGSDAARLSALRRELHRHAEPAFLEFATAWVIERETAHLADVVRRGGDAIDLSRVVDLPSPSMADEWEAAAVAAGYPADRIRWYRQNGTASTVEIVGSRPGPTWGLRSDIDGLPFAESDAAGHVPAAAGFRSRTGAMHACGHDAHTTIGIGLLERLADRDFPGRLRVVFQPAEEGVRGAAAMLDANAIEGVDRMISLHVLGEKPTGWFVGSVTGGLATRKFRAEFTGASAHAAVSPEHGRNALLSAAMAATGVMALSRYGSADTRINVGTLHAGDSVNIVPSHATMTYELRATDEGVLDDLDRRAAAVMRGAAAAYGVDVDVLLTGGATVLDPDDRLVAALVDAASAVPAIGPVTATMPQPGSDDVTLMIRAVQAAGGLGAYAAIGVDSPGTHHSPTFDLDERVLVTAVDLFENLVRSGAV